MAILPDKILADQEISDFVNRVNTRADQILGKSQFEIPSPNLPGLGLLIKLQIRVFEKVIASFFAPIFIGKQIVQEAFTKLRILRYIRDRLQEITQIFTNPIQFLLNEGVNSNLREFPFPIFLLYKRNGSGTGNVGQLANQIENSDLSESSTFLDFDYDIELGTQSNPNPGFVTSPDSSLDTLKSLKVNFKSKVPGETPPLAFLKPGDFFTLQDQSSFFSYSVSQVQPATEFVTLFLQTKSVESSIPKQESQTVFSPGFANTGIRIQRKISLRQFLTPNGSLVIPFSAIGINAPLIKDISLELGNFERLSPTNPTFVYIQNLSIKAGLNFNEVLSGMIDGVFPKIDWNSLQNEENPTSTEVQKSKFEIVAFARFIQIGIENPFFLIKLILNYVKLLLLPIQVFLSVIKLLASKVTSPVQLIKSVFTIIANPLKFFCDAIADAFLEFLRTYLEPPLTPLISWQDLRQDPSDKKRGLKPLFSDLVCGSFGRKLQTYEPSNSFFVQASNSLKTSQPTPPIVQLPYFLTSNVVPQSGELSLGKQGNEQITSIRFSLLTNTVENGAAYLASLKVGDTFYLESNSTIQNYRVSSKKFLFEEESNFVELGVQNLPSSEVITDQSQKSLEEAYQGIVSPQLKASLNINNPDKQFLFIAEKYLPLKALAAWESIKGIFSVTVALAAEIPSLIPAVFKSIFSSGGGTSDQAAILENSSSDFLSGFLNSLDIETDPSRNNWGKYKSGEAREVSQEFFQDIQAKEIFPPGSIDPNDPTPNTEAGIQQVFLELQNARSAEGKPTSISRSDLPADVQSVFRFPSLTLNQVGENLKVLSRIAYELSFRATSSNQDELIEKNIPITVWALRSNGIEEFKIIDNSSLYQAFLDYSFFKSYTPEIRQTTNRVRASDLRYYVWYNFRFAKDVLLPALKD
jgi:hypothetical protein